MTRRWQVCGDRAAADVLARVHVGQVVAQARHYRNQGLPLCDLVGEGNLGLMVALRKFEPERGVRFGAYAKYWIKACIAGSMPAKRGLRSSVFFRLRRERARVLNEVGSSDKAEQILAERLCVSRERVRELLARLDVSFVPYDSELHWPAFCAERLAEVWDQEQQLAHWQDYRQLRLRVERALASLDPRERYIAERRLMVDEEDKPTLAELARHFNISRERVGRLEARTKRKLRAWIGQSPLPNEAGAARAACG